MTNQRLIVAWNDYAVPLGIFDLEEALPLFNAFKAGWEAKEKLSDRI